MEFSEYALHLVSGLCNLLNICTVLVGERMASSLPLPKTSSSPSRTPQGTPQVQMIYSYRHCLIVTYELFRPKLTSEYSGVSYRNLVKLCTVHIQHPFQANKRDASRPKLTTETPSRPPPKPAPRATSPQNRMYKSMSTTMSTTATSNNSNWGLVIDYK